MSKTYTYTLLDRYVTEDGTLVIRAQDDRTGAVVKIHVRPEDAAAAAALWGGSRVPCGRRGGRLWYCPDTATSPRTVA